MLVPCGGIAHTGATGCERHAQDRAEVAGGLCNYTQLVLDFNGQLLTQHSTQIKFKRVTGLQFLTPQDKEIGGGGSVAT